MQLEDEISRRIEVGSDYQYHLFSVRTRAWSTIIKCSLF